MSVEASELTRERLVRWDDPTALAEPVEVAIDFEIGKLPFYLHRQAMRQRALAEILLEQECLAGVKIFQRGDNFFQFGVHLSPLTSSFRE